MREKVFYYKGAIHIHSRYSDGSGGLRHIVKSGRKAGLNFLIITDHNHLRLKEKGAEGWYRNLLVLVGEEVSHSDQHLLAVNVSEAIPEDLSPERSAHEVHRQGGLAFVAHPDGRYRFLWRHRDQRWKSWDVPHLHGMEVWSYMFDWIEEVTPFNLLYYLFRPDEAIQGPRPETLERWDRFNSGRRFVGIAGVDAHARGIYPLQIFPYRHLFRRLVTYVFSEEPLSRDSALASQQVRNLLERGRCYLAFEKLAPAAGVRFEILGNGSRAQMGDRIPFTSGLELRMELGRRADFRLLRNGGEFFRATGRRWTMPVPGPGVYRLEARLNRKPWLFTNPIVVEETA